jgi:hypothetical protein
MGLSDIWSAALGAALVTSSRPSIQSGENRRTAKSNRPGNLEKHGFVEKYRAAETPFSTCINEQCLTPGDRSRCGDTVITFSGT